MRQAASIFTTAIVTGRSKEKVYGFVGLDDVFYAGSHGLEIEGPLETKIRCQVRPHNEDRRCPARRSFLCAEYTYESMSLSISGWFIWRAGGSVRRPEGGHC